MRSFGLEGSQGVTKMASKAFALATLFLAGCVSTPDVATLHQRYMAASNAHNIETIAEMTSDIIVWRLGPYRLEGKSDALLPHETDAVLNTTLEIRDIRIRENVVEAELVERNDALLAVGIDHWRHYVRWVFDEDGKVTRKEPWKESPDDAQVARQLRPLREWIRENHPEAVPDFRDINDVFGRGPALRGKRMREAWIAAGSPGMISPDD